MFQMILQRDLKRHISTPRVRRMTLAMKSEKLKNFQIYLKQTKVPAMEVAMEVAMVEVVVDMAEEIDHMEVEEDHMVVVQVDMVEDHHTEVEVAAMETVEVQTDTAMVAQVTEATITVEAPTTLLQMVEENLQVTTLTIT
jgi:hypothetical protein